MSVPRRTVKHGVTWASNLSPDNMGMQAEEESDNCCRYCVCKSNPHHRLYINADMKHKTNKLIRIQQYFHLTGNTCGIFVGNLLHT